MTTQSERPTAKIIAFPAGGRDVLARRRAGAESVARLDERYAKSPCGSGWYHEAAVEGEAPERGPEPIRFAPRRR
jgi:hypothetical protein